MSADETQRSAEKDPRCGDDLINEHNAEKGAGRTLYAVILAGLIEWAGEFADLEDCREAARHLTPVVRAYVTASTEGGAR